jgi:L-fuculose-phosphate aldolase
LLSIQNMKQIDKKWMSPALQIVKVISRIYKKGQTTTSGGNISIIDDNGDVWITPSAVDKGNLTEIDIVCIKKSGEIIGKHKPSMEYPFHRAIYNERFDIKAVIHAHPPAVVSYSIVRQIPDTKIIPQVYKVCGKVGYAHYGLPGSLELGQIIANEFIKGKHKAVIMENHGLVIGGSDLMDAYTIFETLEHCCQIIINAKTIGEPKYLSEEQIQKYETQIPTNLPENKNINYLPDEQTIRKEICDIVRRACDQELMMSSFGTVSVRWKNNDFLITPHNFIRWEIEPEDIVQIIDGKGEQVKIPSYSFFLHQEIYKRNPHINSIIFTQAPYIMAFGVSGVKFDVRTIPESWIFLQDVPGLYFGAQFIDNETIPDMLSKGISALLVNNYAFIVTGDKLLQTFDKLEVAEFSAKSVVMGTALGKMVPINNEQIEALRKKFLK